MAITDLPQVVVPSSSFRREVEELSGEKVSACFQCEKCTSGCPVTFAMDIVPHKLIRSVHLGLKDEVLRSDTIWVCASCQTCNTRCPNGIDIAGIMDTLRQISQREGIKASQPSVPVFHSAFLSSVKKHGRMHEAEMALTYSLSGKSLREILKLAGMGFSMLLKGKIKLRPNRVRDIGQVRRIFNRVARKG
ncbi:4Fe-4S dicluster domain-containing protein [Chloroflexota bacterium]